MLSISSCRVSDITHRLSHLQVGIILNDNMAIDHMMIGGPAYESGLLEKGDVICEIDHVPVDVECGLMLGSDIPGSSVLLTVRKASGARIDVILEKIPILNLSDQCRMFETIAELKVQSLCEFFFRVPSTFNRLASIVVFCRIV
jgi:C-terminal processing protease CtpA/Prc